MKFISDIKNWYRGLPDKKRYFEFITAILTIPVLLTVIISNVVSIKSKQTQPATENEQNSTGNGGVTVLPIEIIKEKDGATASAQDEGDKSNQNKGIPSPQECKREIGPVEITSPKENEKATENPVEIDISYKTGEYCAVVWSYRINGSKWSEYTDKSIALYNLPAGEKLFELRVKSLASGEEAIVKRIFLYEPAEEIIISTPSPGVTNATSSASIFSKPDLLKRS